ncbi:MAG: hypothetical protein CMF91_00360 [Candidatus Marinimicrobia bacterium]|nr:hypothetical protein [Candidatus Neomarinimicrobiota bacterium]|tara:strand:- start:90 stop:1148 length:1059 start_codon:yes stop_codon:yes gene_type:complete
MRSHHLRAAAGGGLANPFDDMSNFPGASRVGSTDVIFYRQSGTYSFTDPNGGASKFRFTTVGGGGSSTGDGYPYWFGVTGGGGGGAARGEIQTSQTLGISVAQGGYSPGASGVTATNVDQTWTVNSLFGVFNEHYRVDGRGGVSIVKASDGTWLIYGTGGMPGLQGYNSGIYGNLNSWTNGVGYNNRNGGQGFWQNGGFGTVTSGGGVTVTNAYTEFGGTGGPGAHQESAANPPHPLEGTGSNFGLGQPGANTTYAGPGGGGGADGGHTYGSPSVAAAGGAGGTASSLNSLLSGSGYASVGGNGTGYSSQGNPSTRGTLGGGCGGNAGDNASTWLDSFSAAEGVVVVEFLGF